MGKELAGFVASRRTALGLSRKEVAERAQISYPYLSQIETSRREPSIETLRDLADVLQVPVEQLAVLLSSDVSKPSTLSSPEKPRTTDDRRRHDRVLMSLERRLQDVEPVERIALLNELLAQAVQDLRDGR